MVVPLQWKTICSRDSTIGVCSPVSAGGYCRGTPRECKDCNSIADCAGSSVKARFPHFPGKLEPKQIHTGSVFAARNKRVCSTSCNNWPNGNCRVRLSIFYASSFSLDDNSGGSTEDWIFRMHTTLLRQKASFDRQTKLEKQKLSGVSTRARWEIKNQN